MTTELRPPSGSPPARAKRKRRGNGEGSIYQRGDDRWCGSITVGFDASGKRLRKTVYGKTKREVQEQLSRLQNSKLDGTLTQRTKLTVAVFLTRWLEDAARPTIRATTYQSYEGVIRLHISPRIGGIPLAKLTTMHVQHLYASMERDGASPRLRQLTHAVLRRAIKQAVKWGMTPRNICDAVEPPRVPKTEIRPLDASQVATLLEHSREDRLHAIYVLAVTTGLRFGELAGLQWSDIDFESGCLTVKRAIVELNGKAVVSEPKTAHSRRRVDMPDLAVDALHQHRRVMLTEGFAAVDWVFCNRVGNPLVRSCFYHYSFLPLGKRTKLPAFRFHDLRHTSATLLLSAGVHPKIVQERLGHSAIGMTMDTYSHIMPTMQKEAAAKMQAALSAAVG